jgi:hypothetical protein
MLLRFQHRAYVAGRQQALADVVGQEAVRISHCRTPGWQIDSLD